eukprot:CAMPEP_0195061090 /NCGR_PEP_ID=MMETSP0448-20130528/8174_1 /TAXON_ID=66468 /ORGANISM="Heterocapsa triquestra, Strain CCMP 448" /LENGTH=553 /DNA_ID=CAMNT_0040091623 /DNA_START=437 /DNA_END=2100 /DNA_ORIENTATION=+
MPSGAWPCLCPRPELSYIVPSGSDEANGDGLEEGDKIRQELVGHERAPAKEREGPQLCAEALDAHPHADAPLQDKRADLALLLVLIQHVGAVGLFHTHRGHARVRAHLASPDEPLNGLHAELKLGAWREGLGGQVCHDRGDFFARQALFPRPPFRVENAEVQAPLFPAVTDLDVVIHIDIHVCLIDNLLLENLLHDILQRDNTGDHELGIRVHLHVNLPDQPHVRATFLERVERIHKSRVWEEGLHLAVEDPDEVAKLHLILWVGQHQVLRVQKTHVVVLVLTVHGHAAEARLEDLADHVVAQARLRREHVGVLKWGHHLLGRLVAEAQGALGHLLGHLAVGLVARAQRDLQLQHLEQLILAVHCADLPPQEAVQDEAHRLRQDVEHAHEQLHDRHRPGAHVERVTRAARLWEDLSEDEDESGGDKEAHGAAGDLRCQDGDGRVDGNVPQQKRAEQHVPVVAERRNLRRILGELRVASALYYLKPEQIQAHEAQGEAREQPRERDEDGDDGQGDFEGQIREPCAGLLVHDLAWAAAIGLASEARRGSAPTCKG